MYPILRYVEAIDRLMNRSKIECEEDSILYSYVAISFLNVIYEINSLFSIAEFIILDNNETSSKHDYRRYAEIFAIYLLLKHERDDLIWDCFYGIVNEKDFTISVKDNIDKYNKYKEFCQSIEFGESICMSRGNLIVGAGF